jgi:hypothetical protein
MGVTFHVTTNIGMTHVILKITTWTRTLKGGEFGLTRSRVFIYRENDVTFHNRNKDFAILHPTIDNKWYI